jgi:hypothetical protein
MLTYGSPLPIDLQYFMAKINLFEELTGSLISNVRPKPAYAVFHCNSFLSLIPWSKVLLEKLVVSYLVSPRR